MLCCKNRIGQTVIDELRLCYTAGPILLGELKQISIAERLPVGDFYIIRIESKHFQCKFNVCREGNERKQIATLYFGRNGDDESNYVWYRLENWVLYDNSIFQYAMTIPDVFDLKFNNITALDLAQDFQKNITSLIRKLYKDERITTIVNRKAIKNRKQIIPEFFIAYEVCLDRLKNPSFYACQKKSKNDKTKGIRVSCYNKRAEIEHTSGKQYILDYYQNPRNLHRLEVHQNSAEIKDYCDNCHIKQGLELISDKKFLDDLYYYHLSSVISFTQKRTKLHWKNILHGNDRPI